MMGLISERIKQGEECCKLANQRFGLTIGMLSLLNAYAVNDHGKEMLILMYKMREFNKAKKLLSTMPLIDSGNELFVSVDYLNRYKQSLGISTNETN